MKKRRHSQLTGLILDIQMFTSRMQVYCSVSAPVALFFFWQLQNGYTSELWDCTAGTSLSNIIMYESRIAIYAAASLLVYTTHDSVVK